MAKKPKLLQVRIAPDKIAKIDAIRQQLEQQERRVPSRGAIIDRALEFALAQKHWLIPNMP